MFTHVVTRAYRDSSGQNITSTESPTGNAESNLDIAVVAGTNFHIDFDLVRSSLKSMCIESDVAIDLYTNAASGGSPTDHIALIAGQNIVWTLATDLIAKCPISADITAGIYVTNVANANLKIRALRAE
jgi:hypothetical protein